jgi:hypothetical protein
MGAGTQKHPARRSQVMLWNGTDGTCVSKLGEPFSWAPLALLNIVYRRQRLLAVSTHRTPCEY